MPKHAEYTIAWSRSTSGYEITHDPLCFCLNGNADLFFWLGRLETVHFSSRFGHAITLRKEQKQRGAGYWYAYKRIKNKVHKKYLGDEHKITFALLEAIARQLAEPTTTQPPPREEQTTPKQKQATPKQESRATPPPRKPTLTFSHNLSSALRIYGFTSPPNKKALTDRYRDLSKQYHPDKGGLHEDMVAVNLAYDYLKKFL